MEGVITFGDWLNDWVKIYKEPYIKSIKNIKINIRLHIPDKLKNMDITLLTGLLVQQEINALGNNRTALDVYDIYHGSLKMAFNLDIIEKDITKLLIKPKHKRKQGSALSKEELEKFLSDIKGHRLENFFKFCLFTGCRRSEALSFDWSDIGIGNVLHVKGTKTETSDRFIPCFYDLEKLLLSMNVKKSGKLFNHRAEYVTKIFKKFCPNHKLHDLRHTFATTCLECGISMKVVQSWLGHSSFKITADTYSHCSFYSCQAESNKLKFGS